MKLDFMTNYYFYNMVDSKEKEKIIEKSKAILDKELKDSPFEITKISINSKYNKNGCKYVLDIHYTKELTYEEIKEIVCINLKDSLENGEYDIVDETIKDIVESDIQYEDYYYIENYLEEKYNVDFEIFDEILDLIFSKDKELKELFKIV